MESWVIAALVALVVLVVAGAAVVSIWLRRSIRQEDVDAASIPDPKTGTSDDDWFHAIR